MNNKYDNELIKYAKTSGAFEYAAKRYLVDNANSALRQEVDSMFNPLEDTAFPIIEDIKKQTPN